MVSYSIMCVQSVLISLNCNCTLGGSAGGLTVFLQVLSLSLSLSLSFFVSHTISCCLGVIFFQCTTQLHFAAWLRCFSASTHCTLSGTCRCGLFLLVPTIRIVFIDISKFFLRALHIFMIHFFLWPRWFTGIFHGCRSHSSLHSSSDPLGLSVSWVYR